MVLTCHFRMQDFQTDPTSPISSTMQAAVIPSAISVFRLQRRPGFTQVSLLWLELVFMLTINSGFTYSQRHTWSSPRCRTRRAKEIYKSKTEIDWWSQIGVTGGENYIRNTNIIICNLIYCAVHKVPQTVHAYVAQTKEECSSTQKGQFPQLQLHKSVLLLQLTGIVVKTEISTKAVILYATTRQVTPRQGTDRMGSGSTKPTAINPSEMPNTYHKP